MAKKKVVHIDVVVDDKGTTKKIAVDAKALGGQLDKTAKSSKNAQKQAKGLGQQSANGTKNFSKMSQGISGGLVPAYATLAAQIFAVSAAFQFLQSASDYKNLIESQEIYGAIVGTNFAGITKALQQATNGQLKYQEAASATAIGSAAGLSGTQLTELATAANNASVALGRNLTDSFNRLIRGTTKAEPELLDELGIILRLKPATEAYGASIGVAAEKLTAFQRTQAVTNFVIDEAEKKFGKIGKIMNEDAFVIAQFTKSFDDLINTFKVEVITGLTPVFKFLTQNTSALLATLALFAIPITKSMLPAMDEWAKGSKKSAETASLAFTKSKKSLSAQIEQTKALTRTQAGAVKQANKYATSLKGKGTIGGRDGFSFLTGKSDGKRAQLAAKRILDSAEKQVIDSQTVITGRLAGFNKQQVADLRASYVLREQIVASSLSRTTNMFKIASAGIVATWKGATVAIVGGWKLIQSAGVLAIRAIDFAFKVASWVGIGIMIFELGKAAVNALSDATAASHKMRKEIDATTKRGTELVDFLTKVNEVRATDGLLDLTMSITNLGNALTELDMGLFISEIQQLNSPDLKKGSDEYENLQANLAATAEQLNILDPRFEGLIDLIKSGALLTPELAAGFRRMAVQSREYASSLAQLGDLQKSVTSDLVAITGAIVNDPFQKLTNSLKAYIKASDNALEGMSSRAAIMERRREADRANALTKYNALVLGAEKSMNDPNSNLAMRNQIYWSGPEGKARLEANQLEYDLIIDRLDAEAKSDKDQLSSLRKKNAFNKNLSAAMEASEETTKANQDLILSKKGEILEIDKQDNTFAGKRAKLSEAVLNAENKVLEMENKKIQAQNVLTAAKAQSSEATTAEKEEAGRAFDLAERNFEQAIQRLEIENKIENIKGEQLTIEERLFEFDKKRVNLLNTIANKERAVRLAKAGLGASSGEGSVAASRSLRLAEEERIQTKINDLQIASNKAAIKFVDIQNKIGASEKDIADAQRIYITSTNRLDSARDELRISKEREKIDNNALRTKTIDMQLQQQSFSFSKAQQQINEEILRRKNAGQDVDGGTIELITNQIIEQEKLSTVIATQERLREGLTSSLTDGLDGLITGTMTVKQAFASMATSVLKMISRIITEMLVARLIMSAFGPQLQAGETGSKLQGPPLPPQQRHGGITKGYSAGGIARGRNAGYPAILHGTEAVVPLPNGNSIPVEMRNGGGGTNNVGITINIDNNNNAQSEQTGGSGNQAAAIGKLVAGVVQDELQKQKRPGGILSPYGAA